MVDKVSSAAKPDTTPTDKVHNSESIPDIVIGRLPVYLRTLEQLATEGQEVTSSQELGTRLGISSAQIRKDLSHFGEFGKQGTGYTISYLCKQLSAILRVDRIWPIVLVGAGYLGHALASYDGFENRGFRIVAVLDSDTKKIGTVVGELTVEPFDTVSDVVEKHNCQIATLAVPAHSAQAVADVLISIGIRSILCYAPITLTAPPDVRVEYIDPVIYFQHMTFYLDYHRDELERDSLEHDSQDRDSQENDSQNLNNLDDPAGDTGKK